MCPARSEKGDFRSGIVYRRHSCENEDAFENSVTIHFFLHFRLIFYLFENGS